MRLFPEGNISDALDSKICFEMSLIVVEAIIMWTVCEFHRHGYNGNGFGDIWWTDKLFYFSKLSTYSGFKTDP